MEYMFLLFVFLYQCYTIILFKSMWKTRWDKSNPIVLPSKCNVMDNVTNYNFLMLFGLSNG